MNSFYKFYSKLEQGNFKYYNKHRKLQDFINLINNSLENNQNTTTYFSQIMI